MQRDIGKVFYVYILTDPRKGGTPFYVGKGQGDRWKHHIKMKPYDPNRHKKYTIQAILRDGLSVGMQMPMTGLTESEAFAEERRLIASIGRRDLGTGPLTNLTAGGEGEGGRIFSPEIRAKFSERSSGSRNGMFGRRHSEQAKAIMGAARKSRPPHQHSEAHKQHLREHNAGGIAVSRPITQIAPNGLVVAEWPSSSAAAKALHLSKGNIHWCAAHNLHRKTGGCYWRFYEGAV